jgi:hypothetical protein
MKKVLIITYYWPPAGGSGVQRWLKMSKYLRDFGWEPVVYTAENGEMPKRAENVAHWVRGNSFIPDARKYWIKASVRYLSKWLGENKVDAVVNAGPAHSMHFIALGLQKKLGLPWLADFSHWSTRRRRGCIDHRNAMPLPCWL